MARAGAVVVGRGMYEAAEAWGGQNPFGVPLFVVTHRPEEAPSEGGFTFVDGLDEAIGQAREASGDKDISVGGGADVIRQTLRAGYVDELAISIAPVILGGGKRLFDGFEQTLNLEHAALLQSPFATHITYSPVR
jgi:dihydrofolate reductase